MCVRLKFTFDSKTGPALKTGLHSLFRAGLANQRPVANDWTVLSFVATSRKTREHAPWPRAWRRFWQGTGGGYRRPRHSRRRRGRVRCQRDRSLTGAPSRRSQLFPRSSAPLMVVQRRRHLHTGRYPRVLISNLSSLSDAYVLVRRSDHDHAISAQRHSAVTPSSHDQSAPSKAVYLALRVWP